MRETLPAHPAITAPRQELRRLISRRLEDEEGRFSIDVEELYLAAACALGDRAAIDVGNLGECRRVERPGAVLLDQLGELPAEAGLQDRDRLVAHLGTPGG